jgi:hypothetical protein
MTFGVKNNFKHQGFHVQIRPTAYAMSLNITFSSNRIRADANNKMSINQTFSLVVNNLCLDAGLNAIYF